MSTFRERRRPDMLKTTQDKNSSKSGHSDPTNTNLVNLRKTMYSIIMFSEDFDDAGHKMLNIIKQKPGEEMTLCIMLLMCCSEDRTYFQYYGLLGQRICMNNNIIQRNFETCFVQQFSRIHQLEENKLLNVAKFFAHLLATDAISWHVLSYVRLTEEDTTESSRIFIMVLFQELYEQLGIRQLNQRLMQMQDYLKLKPQQEAALASFNYSESESDEDEQEKKKKRRRTEKSIMDCFSSLGLV